MDMEKKIPTNTITRDIKDLAAPTGNIYETVVILSTRANQIALAEKKELAKKLNDAIICVYADEDIGSNCGAYVYFPDGKKVEIKPVEMFAAYVHYGDEPGHYARDYLSWRYPEGEE